MTCVVPEHPWAEFLQAGTRVYIRKQHVMGFQSSAAATQGVVSPCRVRARHATRWPCEARVSLRIPAPRSSPPPETLVERGTT